jgi:hypothetical protein
MRKAYNLYKLCFNCTYCRGAEWLVGRVAYILAMREIKGGIYIIESLKGLSNKHTTQA